MKISASSIQTPIQKQEIAAQKAEKKADLEYEKSLLKEVCSSKAEYALRSLALTLCNNDNKKYRTQNGICSRDTYYAIQKNNLEWKNERKEMYNQRKADLKENCSSKLEYLVKSIGLKAEFNKDEPADRIWRTPGGIICSRDTYYAIKNQSNKIESQENQTKNNSLNDSITKEKICEVIRNQTLNKTRNQENQTENKISEDTLTTKKICEIKQNQANKIKTQEN